MAVIRGGEKAKIALAQIARAIGRGGRVRVGFLEGSTYPDGTPTAMIAAIHNYGAPAAGIPPRPFFSNMVEEKSPEWPAAIGKLLREHEYDSGTALKMTGEAIAGQLRQSIVDTNDPPLKPATIRRKGFDKPLVDTGHLLNSVDYEVDT